ncbi:MAG: hypothetical protein V8R46_10680 [Eubacterium ramulus]
MGVKAVLYDGSYHPVDSSRDGIQDRSNSGVQKRIYGCFPDFIRANCFSKSIGTG